MCGILCVFGTSNVVTSSFLTHRGPDGTLDKTLGVCWMEFSRLAINDLSSNGMQPFIQNNKMLVCNGEIYNHLEFDSESTNDCKCLVPLIEEFGIFEASKKIHGVFAICYTDGERLLASRDPFGVRPLFYTRFEKGKMALASEVKALLNFKTKIEIFPPGHIYDSVSDQFVCWYPCYWDLLKTPSDPNKLRPAFEEAVRIRIENTDRKVGFLLSGGLDSSLVAAIGKQYMRHGTTDGRIRTFSVGTSTSSPDILAARIMAKYLDSDHKELIFDPATDGILAIESVIKSIESYDTTSIRASVPMWLLAKYISEHTDCKVILSGEGSDELFGGYLYFHYAPNVNDFSKECGRRLALIHQFDGLRADRCMAAHGLELRVPFLDRKFVELGMTIDQTLKVPGKKMEKWVLREAFEGVLPHEILWRQKNGMSDAVGYNWVDTVKEFANKVVEIPYEGQTKEETMYYSIFNKYFPNCNHLISEIWRPRWTNVLDPSARQLNVFARPS
jgi:asparagine synthase (glutamine-hydrolysing)